MSPMLGRAATRHGSCCGGPPGIDCADYGYDNQSQRRYEDRQWRREEDADMIRISRDLNADVLYVHVTDANVADTVQADDATFVDLDAAGGVVGVEALGPLRAWTIAAILDRYEFEPGDGVMLRALIKPKRGDGGAHAVRAAWGGSGGH